MKQKEKQNLKYLNKKRIILSLAFLCLIGVVFWGGNVSAVETLQQSADKITTGGAGFVAEWAATPLLLVINTVLYAIYAFFGFLLIIAGVLFDWAINPANFSAVMSMDAIRNGWVIVRDILNLFFIMVLLFSAFCTVLQISKYNIKNILLNLVIMALLVNFSFPIARIIIDASNIIMYYILNSAFPDLSNNSGISTILVQFSSILENLLPAPHWLTYGEGMGGSGLTIRLVAANTFIFLLATTLLMIGMLFVIRIVVLAILIIFSPIAFAGSIFPGMGSYSSKWWDQIFKQSFFGPIMAFMLYLALTIMSGMQQGGSESINAKLELFAKNNTANGNFSEIIVTGVLMAIPLALLWIGMGVANQMGAYGAEFAQKYAMKGMKLASGVAFAQDTWKAYKARRDKAKEDNWSGKLGRKLASQQDRLRSNFSGGRDAGLRYENDISAEVKREKERSDMEHMDDDVLRQVANNGNKFEKAAARQVLADKSKATAADLEDVRQTFGETSQVFRELQSKVKTYNPAAAYQHVDNSQGARDNKIYDTIRSDKFDSGKLSAEALSNTGLMEMLFTAQKISNDDMEKLRKKSVLHKNNLKSTLEIIAHYTENSNLNNESHKNIQMAYLSQTGKISDTVKANPNWQKKIFGEAGKDNLKRISSTDTIRNGNPEHNSMADYASMIAPHLSGGQLKDIIRGMEDNESRTQLTRHIGNNPAPATPNEVVLKSIAEKDPYLRSLL